MNAWERRRRRQIGDLPAALVRRLVAKGKTIMSLEEFVREAKKYGR